MMNPIKIIEKYYEKGSSAYNILVSHSSSVTEKALIIIQNHPELHINADFVKEAAMIHDIGIFLTNAPAIGCFGYYPYICHGYLGREIMDKEGFPLHGLVCERHTGVGISLKDIVENNLPLPHREMKPVSIEEQLICFADCFYSKTQLGKEKTVEKIRNNIAARNEESVKQFDEWCEIFL